VAVNPHVAVEPLRGDLMCCAGNDLFLCNRGETIFHVDLDTKAVSVAAGYLGGGISGLACDAAGTLFVSKGREIHALRRRVLPPPPLLARPPPQLLLFAFGGGAGALSVVSMGGQWPEATRHALVAEAPPRAESPLVRLTARARELYHETAQLHDQLGRIAAANRAKALALPAAAGDLELVRAVAEHEERCEAPHRLDRASALVAELKDAGARLAVVCVARAPEEVMKLELGTELPSPLLPGAMPPSTCMTSCSAVCSSDSFAESSPAAQPPASRRAEMCRRVE
jgi:hypothetical protein